MHIFTQSGWLILFSPYHLSGQHQIEESRQTLSLPQKDKRNDCPLSSIAAAAPPWGKPSNLWTPCVYSLRPSVPSWIWIRWIQYATHRNSIGDVDCDAKFRSDIQLLHHWVTFSGDIHASPRNNKNHKLMGDYNVPVLNQQTRLLLHLWWHISLTHSTML